MSPLPPGEVLWQPPTDVLETTRIGHYMQWLASERGLSFDDYRVPLAVVGRPA